MSLFNNITTIQSNKRDFQMERNCSFVVGQEAPWYLTHSKALFPKLPLGAFSVTEEPKSKGSDRKTAMMPLKRTPSDEILLTELALDDKDITIYDITSVILVGEKESKEPHGQFKCFMDHGEKKFYIEIATTKALEALTKSAVLNLLSLAEQTGSEKVYVCCRMTLGDIRYYLKTFMFIGFQQLTEEEQREISMTQTHFLLSYDVLGDEEN